MKNIQGLKVLFAVLFTMLIFSGAALGQRKYDCSRTSDAWIAASVNSHIKRLKAKNPRTNVRIVVRVKDKIVRLTVGKTPKNIHQEVARYARNIRCVKRVEVNIPPKCIPGSCPKNTYECGGQCIPCAEVCSP